MVDRDKLYETKHTAGPWTLCNVDNDLGRKFQINDRNGDVVVNIVRYNGAEANAQLIAAAPDLLKACREVVTPYNIIDCDHCEGVGIEPNAKEDACHICGGYGEVTTGDIMEAVKSCRNAISKAEKDE